MGLIKTSSFEETIKKYNPFGVRDEKGEPMMFEDYGKCYLHVLKQLKKQFPRGFIDVPLFLMTLSRIPLNDARRFAKNSPFIKMDREIYLCPWEDEKSNTKYLAELLMRALHTLTETKFSTDFYNAAWNEFSQTP